MANTMRYLMIARLEAIKENERGFDKRTMRWKEFKTGLSDTHISKVDFTKLSDISLLHVFELVTKRYYAQM